MKGSYITNAILDAITLLRGFIKVIQLVIENSIFKKTTYGLSTRFLVKY